MVYVSEDYENVQAEISEGELNFWKKTRVSPARR